MFGSKAKRLAHDLAMERNQLLIEAAEKGERIARLDADCQRMAEKVRDLRAAEARHMRAMAQQVRETEEARRATEEAKREARVVGKALNEMLAERDAARDALRKIADMVTPGSAPIGKRMAKVAADHLAGGDAVQAEAA